MIIQNTLINFYNTQPKISESNNFVFTLNITSKPNKLQDHPSIVNGL